jgi:crossover junction endodeoxyribonuclease RuvC
MMSKMSTPTRPSVLAIDPGYDRIGIAVFAGDILVHSECFVPPSKDFSRRLMEVYQRVTTMIHTYKPGAVAIETLFMTKNQKTAIKVAEARGVAILAAAEAGTPLFGYSPQAVKIAVTGSGNADKKSVTKMVDLMLKLPPKKRFDDEYDAIALGLAHQAAARISGPAYRQAGLST